MAGRFASYQEGLRITPDSRESVSFANPCESRITIPGFYGLGFPSGLGRARKAPGGRPVIWTFWWEGRGYLRQDVVCVFRVAQNVH